MRDGQLERCASNGAGGEIRYAPLVDTLESAVSPGQWQKMGGAGSATPYQGMLVVSQSPASGGAQSLSCLVVQ